LCDDFKDAPHSVVSDAAVFQAQSQISARAVKAHKEAMDIARHRLRLTEQLAVGGIEAEAVIEIAAGDAEFNEGVRRHFDRFSGRRRFKFLIGSDGFFGDGEGKLLGGHINHLVGDLPARVRKMGDAEGERGKEQKDEEDEEGTTQLTDGFVVVFAFRRGAGA